MQKRQSEEARRTINTNVTKSGRYLGVENIAWKARQARMRWYGHFLLMDEENKMKHVSERYVGKKKTKNEMDDMPKTGEDR